MANRVGDVITGYMDGIDAEEHLGHDAHGAVVFPSVSACHHDKDCIAIGGCGLVEVEVRIVRWVEPQNLKGGVLTEDELLAALNSPPSV